MYECQTCGQTVNGLNAARKHAKQGHKTQREAFQAGQLHTLTRKETTMNDIKSLVLIYQNENGDLFEQRATDLVSCGTLSDADTGEDLELIGWRANNA